MCTIFLLHVPSTLKTNQLYEVTFIQFLFFREISFFDFILFF